MIAQIIHASGLESEIIRVIEEYSKGDELKKQRIIECFARLPYQDGSSPEQLALLDWAIEKNPHRVPDNTPKESPSSIEGLLSMALAECSLVVDSVQRGDSGEVQRLLDDARHNLTLAEVEIKRAGANARAAHKPRPKRKPTNKSLTVEEMREWRQSDHTFEEFMEAACNDSIDGLTMETIAGDKVILYWGDIAKEKKSIKTLLDWWSDSKKK
jgi:hypothetical protein